MGKWKLEGERMEKKTRVERKRKCPLIRTNRDANPWRGKYA